MKMSSGMRSMVMGAFCLAVIVCVSIPAEALPARYAMQPGMTQMILSTAGIETETVALFRTDGINRAIYIPHVRGNDLLIGFPRAGIGLDVPFLLVINGEELIVEATSDGTLNVLEGDPAVMPADIGDFINCLVNQIGDLARAILELDIGGIIGNTLQLIGCIFQIL